VLPISAIRFVALFTVFLVASTSQAQPKEPIPDISVKVKQAIELAESGKTVQGIALLKEILESNPTNVTVLRNLGLMFYQSHQFDSAIVTYNRAIELDSLQVDLLLTLGTVYVDSGLVDEAFAVYQKSLELDSLNERTYIELAFAFGEKSDLERSALMLKKALRLSPYNPTAHYNLGTVYFQTKQWANSIDHFVLCRDIHTAYPALEPKLHILLDSAKPHLEDWVDREPSNPKAHYYLSYSLCFEGNYKNAVKEVERAIKLDPTEPQYYKALGLFRESQGKDKDARKAYQKCYDLDSTCWACGVPLVFFLRSKDREKALSLMERIASDHPKVYAVQFELGTCYSYAAYEMTTEHAVPMFEKAVSAYLSALSLSTSAPDATLRFNIASSCYNLGRYELARHHALAAERLGHNKASSLLKLISSEISGE
jgi:tetratricopeptide (TPR) repeat protein